MPLLNNDTPSQTAEELLRPYLDATLTLASTGSPSSGDLQPLFTMFYTRHPNGTVPGNPENSSSLSPILHTKPYAPHLPEIADSAATNGEAIFWDTIKALKTLDRHPGRKNGDDSGEDNIGMGREVDSFWPPLEYIEENDDW